MAILLALFSNFFQQSVASKVLQVLARIFVITLHSHFGVLSLWFFSATSGSAARRHGQGQVVGQVVTSDVVGQLIATRPVAIMAASFRNTAYKRLLLEEEDTAMASDTIGLMSQSSPAPTQEPMNDGFHGLPPK